MTAFDRFDPFEPRIRGAIDEIAATRRPDYLDGILRTTARTRQRPRWSFPARWLAALDSMPTASEAKPSMRAVLLVVMLVLLGLVAATVLIAGARPALLPTGPGRNGAVVYDKDGALWVRSSVSASDDRILVSIGSGPGSGLADPNLAPDGRSLAFVDRRADGDYVYGTVLDLDDPTQRHGARLLLERPIGPGRAGMWWSPDSSFLLVTGQFENGTRRLFQARADGTGAREIALPDGLAPYDALPSPLDPDAFLLRALTMSTRSQGLYPARLDGSVGARFDLVGASSFGPEYTLSGAQWSPDGSTIAYNAFETDAVTQETSFRVHLVDADGTNDRLLPAPADPRIHQAWPTWSPDGTTLMVERFVLATDGARDASSWVAVVPADGSSPGHDLLPRSVGSAGTGTVKVWSPDGSKAILNFDDLQQTWLVDIATGEGSEVQWGDHLPEWQRLAP
jgi:hypothetical protein